MRYGVGSPLARASAWERVSRLVGEGEGGSCQATLSRTTQDTKLVGAVDRSWQRFAIPLGICESVPSRCALDFLGQLLDLVCFVDNSKREDVFVRFVEVLLK
jgi:hypothetical protein